MQERSKKYLGATIRSRQRQVICGHRGLISGFALVDSEHYKDVYAISVSWDRRICVWDLRKASIACTHKVQDYFQDHVGWTDATKCLTTVFRSTASDDANRKARTAEEVSAQELACDGFIRDVCYSAELDQFAYASSEGVVYIREFALQGADMCLVGTLVGHEGDVVKVLWNDVTKVWVTGSHDRTVRVWEAQAPHGCLFNLDAVNPVTAMCIDTAGGHVVIGADRILRVFDTATGRLLQTNSGHTASINSVMYSSQTHEVQCLEHFYSSKSF